MFIGKDTRLAPNKDLINMYVETGFTSNLDKTTIEAYTIGRVCLISVAVLLKLTIFILKLHHNLFERGFLLLQKFSFLCL